MLSSTKGSDENSMRAQLNVSPVEYAIPIEAGAGALDYPIPPFSLSILRLKVK